MEMLPLRALTNFDLLHYGKYIRYFRGVFMRNNLPKKPRSNECGIINLDGMEGPGTHWVAYNKKGNRSTYFDSFGNLPPPQELIQYLLCSSNIEYNYTKFQDYNTYVCGHLCLAFLLNKNKII